MFSNRIYIFLYKKVKIKTFYYCCLTFSNFSFFSLFFHCFSSVSCFIKQFFDGLLLFWDFFFVFKESTLRYLKRFQNKTKKLFWKFLGHLFHLFKTGCLFMNRNSAYADWTKWKGTHTNESMMLKIFYLHGFIRCTLHLMG